MLEITSQSVASQSHLNRSVPSQFVSHRPDRVQRRFLRGPPGLFRWGRGERPGPGVEADAERVGGGREPEAPVERLELVGGQELGGELAGIGREGLDARERVEGGGLVVPAEEVGGGGVGEEGVRLLVELGVGLEVDLFEGVGLFVFEDVWEGGGGRLRAVVAVWCRRSVRLQGGGSVEEFTDDVLKAQVVVTERLKFGHGLVALLLALLGDLLQDHDPGLRSVGQAVFKSRSGQNRVGNYRESKYSLMFLRNV